MQPCSNGDNFDAHPIIFDLWFLLCTQVLSSDVHKTASATVPIFLRRSTLIFVTYLFSIPVIFLLEPLKDLKLFSFFDE